MTSAIGWYGPLIDLSKAALHIGDFVQLLVFVHRSTPVQFKLSKGGEVIRTDIQVGDDSRPFFSVSLWQKQMASIAVAGDVILLQNVKITKFGDAVEARTENCSSLLPLIHPFESLVSKGLDDLMVESRVGTAAREKFRKVVKWARQAGATLFNTKFQSFQKGQLSRNWKVPGESESRRCFSLSEVSQLFDSCKAIFSAFIGEMFLPITWKALGDNEKEKMFISRRLSNVVDDSLVEDLICTGCRLCGSTFDMQYRSVVEQTSFPLYCPKSSNHLHAVSMIYRPFMLYLWDESDYMPLLVRNKAAELLFGNIKAEKVYLCYRKQKQNQKSDPKDVDMENDCKVVADSCSVSEDKTAEGRRKHQLDRKVDFHLVWLLLLKMLLLQGKNSPYKFEVTVNLNLDREYGRYEMISLSIPCIETK
ncbi:hypothetical protein HS088_TW11G00368 [Tripterygium wilfordii]|uniref:Uncharacterized protein n=2 Tax=Tripterygium wilfordii TaxID=458696 RepID=A0A7J7D1U4_TRIWF|nr:hypothetical protein HS088_TW11G00368 [Tripterygium wilfordii]